MKLSTWLVLLGSVFVAVVSLIAAFRVEEIILKVLLILSTMVTLAIAVWRVYSKKRTDDEIQKLKEDKQDKLVFASEETCIAAADEIDFKGL